LDDDRSGTTLATNYKISDLDFDDVTRSQLAVNCKIEQRAVSKSSLAMQVKPDRPYLLRL